MHCTRACKEQELRSQSSGREFVWVSFGHGSGASRGTAVHGVHLVAEEYYSRMTPLQSAERLTGTRKLHAPGFALTLSCPAAALQLCHCLRTRHIPALSGFVFQLAQQRQERFGHQKAQQCAPFGQL